MSTNTLTPKDETKASAATAASGPVSIDAPRRMFFVAHCAATDGSRYSIPHVMIERRDGLLRTVATNGRVLLVAQVKTTALEPLTLFVPRRIALKLAELPEASPIHRTAEGGCEVVHPVEDGTATLRWTEAAVEFPPYLDVIPHLPESKGLPRIAFGHAQVAAVIDAMVAVVGEPASPIDLHLPPAANRPFAMRASSAAGDLDVTAVVMPVNSELKPLPTFGN